MDRGEAAVIQLALMEKVSTVCIDEVGGSHDCMASLTGSISILIRAQREGYPFVMSQAIARMRERGTWLSERVIRIALEQSR